MSNTVYNVFDRSEEVIEDTWGHLKAEPGRRYKGWIMVYYSCYGDYGILDWDFPYLDPSPWQLIHFNAWVDKLMSILLDEVNAVEDLHERNKISASQVGVYIYQGWYEPSKTGSGARFKQVSWEKLEL